MIGSLIVAAALCGQGQDQSAYLSAAGAVLVAGWAEHFKAAPVVIDGRTSPGDEMSRPPARYGPVGHTSSRRARRNAAYKAQLAREAAEERAMLQAQAQARAEYQRMLPYMLEARRQNLQYQAAHEQAQATRDIANSITRSAGYAQGVQQPVRVVNDPSVYFP